MSDRHRLNNESDHRCKPQLPIVEGGLRYPSRRYTRTSDVSRRTIEVTLRFENVSVSANQLRERFAREHLGESIDRLRIDRPSSTMITTVDDEGTIYAVQIERIDSNPIDEQR